MEMVKIPYRNGPLSRHKALYSKWSTLHTFHRSTSTSGLHFLLSPEEFKQLEPRPCEEEIFGVISPNSMFSVVDSKDYFFFYWLSS